MGLVAGQKRHARRRHVDPMSWIRAAVREPGAEPASGLEHKDAGLRAVGREMIGGSRAGEAAADDCDRGRARSDVGHPCAAARGARHPRENFSERPGVDQTFGGRDRPLQRQTGEKQLGDAIGFLEMRVAGEDEGVGAEMRRYSSMRSATVSGSPTSAVPAPPRTSPTPAHRLGLISSLVAPSAVQARSSASGRPNPCGRKPAGRRQSSRRRAFRSVGSLPPRRRRSSRAR